MVGNERKQKVESLWSKRDCLAVAHQQVLRWIQLKSTEAVMRDGQHGLLFDRPNDAQKERIALPSVQLAPGAPKDFGTVGLPGPNKSPTFSKVCPNKLDSHAHGLTTVIHGSAIKNCK